MSTKKAAPKAKEKAKKAKPPAKQPAPKARKLAARKTPVRPAEVAPPPPPPLPDPAGDAPLHELSRDHLSVLLFVALLPEETKALVRELGLQIPGFRQDSLSDVERCDALADEIRAVPETRARVLALLRKAFGRPPQVALAFDEVAADDLLAVGSSENQLVLSLWRVLADPAPPVRARARPLLDRLVKEQYGPVPKGEGPAREGEDPAAEDEAEWRALEQKLAAAETRARSLAADLERAEQRLAGAQKKFDEQKDKLQEWLKEARARAAAAVDEAARAREAGDAAARAREKAEVDLAAAKGTDEAAMAKQARALAKELEGKLAAAEGRLGRAGEREAALAAELEALKTRAAGSPAPVAETAAVEGEEPEEATAAWLMPVYTREFYDSIEGWDRRIQRAAFKQAHLLAQDHRHPSLRALPLEGLPGYYRVRVATDVRLLYRRGDRQNTVEILSLIDREDLDRYVRQAKTR